MLKGRKRFLLHGLDPCERDFDWQLYLDQAHPHHNDGDGHEVHVVQRQQASRGKAYKAGIIDLFEAFYKVELIQEI